MRPAVFLDRDGVLNSEIEGPPRRPPWRLEELQILPGVEESLERLATANVLLLVVTNQPDIARGDVSAEVVAVLNRRLSAMLPLDDVYVCPHTNEDGCHCRKPLPGLIELAMREHSVDLAESWLVGDRWVDIAAARAAGVRSILLEQERSWWASSAGEPPPMLRPDATVYDIEAAADLILDSLSSHGPDR
jgi:D-glycero-D-manno-heptose 1,7-bisphosphate phosphatase